MFKKRYLRHPIKPTQWSKDVMRARLSLSETQAEFAVRFQVIPYTVHNWEIGRSEHVPHIYRFILEDLIKNLKDNGIWLNTDVFDTIYRDRLERKGNALG